MGYIVEKATDEYLGLVTSHGATGNYLQTAGEFVFVTVTESTRSLMDGTVMPWWVAVGLALIGAAGLGLLGVWGARRRRHRAAASPERAPPRPAAPPEEARRTPIRFAVWVAACVALTAASVLWTIWLAAPTFYVGNLLSRKSTLNNDPPYLQVRLGRDAAARFWTDVVCSRITYHQEPGCTDPHQRDPEAVLRAHAGRLHRHFLIHLAGTLLVFAGAMWLLTSTSVWTRAFGPGVVAAVLLAAVLELLGTVPYVYAKTIRSTQRKLVKIHRAVDNTLVGDLVEERSGRVGVRMDKPYYRGGVWWIDGNQVRAIYRKKQEASAVTLQYEGQRRVEENHGWLVAESETTITLFDSEERSIWEVPRAATTLIVVEGLNDVLAKRLDFNYKALGSKPLDSGPAQPTGRDR